MRTTLEIKNILSALEDGPGNLVLLAGLCMELCEHIEDMGAQIDNHGRILEQVEETAHKAANTASMLANGIQPD